MSGYDVCKHGRIRCAECAYVEDLEDRIEELEQQNKRYKQALEYIQRAIYTQHCTKNHKWNTEFEKGQISGLIQASNIVKKATENSGNTARQALEGESDA